MDSANIALARTASQHISSGPFATPYEVVKYFGAMQAQDYASSLWAIGLRTTTATQQDVEAAIAARKIVRTWPMRGTLHFAAAEDVRWILTLLGERILRSTETRKRNLDLDDTILHKARQIIVGMLSGGRECTRLEIFAALGKAGISSKDQRGYHILLQLSLQQVVCFGPHTGKQPTFVLLDEWVPLQKHHILTRDDSLAKIAQCYFRAHGPALLSDFAGWAGLTLADARRGIEQVRSISQIANTQLYACDNAMPPQPGTFLLPAFDEFILGYKNRSDIMLAEHMAKVVPGNNGVFQPTIITNGHVVGTWKRTITPRQVTVQLLPFNTLSKTQHADIGQALKRYQAYSGLPIVIILK